MKFAHLRERFGSAIINLDVIESDIKTSEELEGVNPKLWYLFEDKKVLFKETPEPYGCIGEVLYAKLAKQCDLDCAEYYFATRDGNEGVLTPDFIKGNEYISGDDLIFNHHSPLMANSKNIDKLLIGYYRHEDSKRNNLHDVRRYLEKEFEDKEVVNKLEKQLLKMFVLDYLLYQEDRHSSNWGILKNESSANLIVFENENILNMTRDKKYFEEMKNKIAKGEKVENDKQRGKYTFSLLPADSDTPFLEQILQVYKNGDVKKQEVIESVLGYFNFEDEITNFEFLKKLDSDLKYVSYMQVANRKVALIRGVEKIKEERKLEAGKTR